MSVNSNNIFVSNFVLNAQFCWGNQPANNSQEAQLFMLFSFICRGMYTVCKLNRKLYVNIMKLPEPSPFKWPNYSHHINIALVY